MVKVQEIGVVLLAAGSGKRMGKTKQLLPWAGKPLIKHTIDNLVSVGFHKIVVVLGHQAEKIKKSLDMKDLVVVENPGYEKGQGESLKVGIKTLEANFTVAAAMVVLADQPLVTAEVYRTLAEKYREIQHDNKPPILVPTFEDQRGNPVLFDSFYFKALQEIPGDKGGRDLLRAYEENLFFLPVDCKGILLDIDTPASYEALQSESSRAMKRSLGLKKETKVISVVGAGGKTSLIFALASELGSEKVVITTTTKMFRPEKLPVVWHEGELNQLKREVSKQLETNNIIFLAREPLENNKVLGVNEEVIDFLAASFPNLFFLVEADGSARKPFKAPAQWEPVVPKSTDIVIVVLGVDIMGEKLSEENCHRWDLISQLTGLKYGESIDPKAVAKVLLNPKGYGPEKFTPARTVYFLNKVDDPERNDLALKLKDELLKHAKDSPVVLASLQKGMIKK